MITVRDLSFTYARATKPAIQELGFAVERGEILVSWDRAAQASPRRRKS
jgi:energy-coupling factor transporter ATP-binding protein EcfA2